MSVGELLTNINREDKTVPFAIERAIPQIEKLISTVVSKMENGADYSTSGQAPVADLVSLMLQNVLPPTG